jgi:peptide/nickel transport system substrate-binding protein
LRCFHQAEIVDEDIQTQAQGTAGLAWPVLGKSSSNVPFIVPKRVADTDANTQISELSIHLQGRRAEAPDAVVDVKFAKYKSSSEPASDLARGKVGLEKN